MKILYVSNGSNFLTAGGMEYHLMDMCGWLEKNGVETGLAVRKDTFLHRNLLAGKAHVYPLPWTGAGKVASIFRLVRAIREFDPDIISINREKDIVRIFLIVKGIGAFLKKKPKIVSVFHNVGWNKNDAVLSRLDGMIFPNCFIRDHYFDGGEINVPAEVIYHGIRLPEVRPQEKLDPFRKRKFFKNKTFPIIGMVGELRKNQTELIDVAFYLKRQLNDFTIAIVGRGKDEETAGLREKIEHLGLADNILLTGNVERSLIPDIFYDLDISVTTNRREPFGMVFIESLASMTPLVAYDSGGPVEIIGKGGGILVSGGPQDMAVELHRIVTDNNERRRLSEEARGAAEQYFSIHAMGAAHLRFYRQLNFMKTT